MKMSVFLAITLWSVLCMGQAVHVSQAKGSIVMSVSAQKPYLVISAGERKTPILSVECIHKGKKSGHIVKFSPGGSLVEDTPEKGGQLTLNMTIAGTKHETTWANSGDSVTFVYWGAQEPERLTFLQSLLNSGAVSIEFTPYLTGVPITSTFDLSKLRDEMNKYPECTATK